MVLNARAQFVCFINQCNCTINQQYWFAFHNETKEKNSVCFVCTELCGFVVSPRCAHPVEVVVRIFRVEQLLYSNCLHILVSVILIFLSILFILIQHPKGLLIIN